ncbi:MULTISPECIES: hypothetical protein [Shewanella]|uniref:EF-hand domain-containing protein n=1 Tax=Shewanella vesiculosa TaxID=518738 RepID=A0ABV0FN72_9GAMM|nr:MULTISPECIES: hypothetical protein [Shewanella]NCQ46008.1 hypothetical protein [Shewanella frigidimarina]NCO70466.1 hypothetical protein [Shewanella vesiculosa]NCP36462.1 hypothetical protein [Shewanella vesiculosa]NCP69743.1 hypothetical protein [Shewanella vesiculosa]NCP75513.1 hypothetical protein [Shewanella vesiculosa]
MNSHVVSVLLVCLTTSLPVTAIGNENGAMRMSQMPEFSDFDKNQDKLISEEEFVQFQKARQELHQSEGRMLKNASRDGMFERIDLDHNKFIDAEEFQSHREMMRKSK